MKKRAVALNVVRSPTTRALPDRDEIAAESAGDEVADACRRRRADRPSAGRIQSRAMSAWLCASTRMRIVALHEAGDRAQRRVLAVGVRCLRERVTMLTTPLIASVPYSAEPCGPRMTSMRSIASGAKRLMSSGFATSMPSM